MNEKDRLQLEAETRDPKRIYAGCGLHGYYGPSHLVDTKPATGCADCWKAWWLAHILKFPASERAAALDQAFEAIAKCNEAVENGTWDFTPFEKPEIHIDKDAY